MSAVNTGELWKKRIMKNYGLQALNAKVKAPSSRRFQWLAIILAVSVPYGLIGVQRVIAEQAKSTLQAPSASFSKGVIHSGTQKASLIVSPNLRLSVGRDVAALIRGIAQVSKQPVLLIVTQPKRLEPVFKSTDKNIVWSDLQLALRKAGFLNVVFDNPNAIGVIQGQGYLLGDVPVKDCERRDMWNAFWKGYQKLQHREQNALVSHEGIYIPADMKGAPEDWAKLLQGPLKFQFSKPSPYPSRIHLTLHVAINTAFPEAPANMAFGWWKWSTVDFPAPLKFPEHIVFPNIKTPAWMGKTMQLGSGLIASARILAELQRLTGEQIKLSKSFSFPTVAVAGGDITAGQLLLSLKAASLLEMREMPADRLLYFTSPSRLPHYVGSTGMTGDEYNAYLELLQQLEVARGVDLGPLPYGLLQMPTSALPVTWSQPLLSDEPPVEAYQQVGLDPHQSITPQKTEQAVQKWLNDYGKFTWISLPAISLMAEYQENREQRSTSAAEPWWTPIIGQDILFLPTCQSPRPG